MRYGFRRREEILQYLIQHSFAKVGELARRFHCSQMTIRRDLMRLEAEGVLSRTHGGAKVSSRINIEFAMAEEAKRHRREKAAIGRAAVGLITPGERILIGSGTTTRAMAGEMRTCEGISVVTTSLGVAAALLSAPGVECMIVGGTLHKECPDLYGPLLEENLSHVRCDCGFIGTQGVSGEGVLGVVDPDIARVTRLAMTICKRVVLLVDSSKARWGSLVTFGHFDQVYYLVTDRNMPLDILETARRAGVRTIIVKPRK